ncbi:MAG: hypothetical protein CM15mV107_010 [Caudoviricetes sp.]|nr:MAG: hypothetical protein CM15mV107_010 [Caudoviricetes sp.]
MIVFQWSSFTEINNESRPYAILPCSIRFDAETFPFSPPVCWSEELLNPHNGTVGLMVYLTEHLMGKFKLTKFK